MKLITLLPSPTIATVTLSKALNPLQSQWSVCIISHPSACGYSTEQLLSICFAYRMLNNVSVLLYVTRSEISSMLGLIIKKEYLWPLQSENMSHSNESKIKHAHTRTHNFLKSGEVLHTASYCYQHILT